jgi:hypothetical protein
VEGKQLVGATWGGTDEGVNSLSDSTFVFERSQRVFDVFHRRDCGWMDGMACGP